MTDGSLSPFFEQPRPLYGGETSLLKEKISRLEYEVSSLKTEKKLVEQSKHALTGRYETLLANKNDELVGLQNNFDYVFKQREELQTKLKNQKDIAGKSTDGLNSEAATLRKENRTLTSKLDKLERLYNSVTGKCEHLRSDLNRELSSNDQFRERINTLDKENARLAQLNDDILDRMKLLSAQVDSGNASRKTEDLQLRLLALQDTNNQLQFKVDLLLQLKTSVELLKHKNASLASKINLLELSERRAEQLELANIELQAKFDEYFAVISQSIEESESVIDSDKDVVLSFVQNYKRVQNRSLVLFDKLNETQNTVTGLEEDNEALKIRISSELQPQIAHLQAKIQDLNTEVADLKKTKVLNCKEIEFLRNSLKDLDVVAARKHQVAANPDESSKEQEAQRHATNQYLTNLEKLVDDYKKEIEGLRALNSVTSPRVSIPTKRPRLVDEDDTRARAANALRNENLELLAQIKSLNDEATGLRTKLKVLEEASKRASSHVVELRQNPFSMDQKVKQETLDLLRKENEDLISKYIRDKQVEVVPMAIFARQENDKDILQSKIDQLVKKINRLKSVYADKSKEIIAVISRYFGYSIEFIPSPMNPNDLCSKIKLVSRYLAQKDPNSTPPYLVLDVRSKSLKANGNYEFKTLCEELVAQWVSEKNQIPCFLSALNLRIYEDYTN